MPLPPALTAALAGSLNGKSRHDLAARAAALSARYRAGGASAILGPDDALAYTLARMPATYAAVAETLRRLHDRCPSFTPASLIDAGCGPGTASWAALAYWPKLTAITQLDHSAVFLELGRRLGEAVPALWAAKQLQGALQNSIALSPADLIICSYALAELTDAATSTVLDRLWQNCTGALVIVEPGTPAGYRRVIQARDWLIGNDAAIAAPCPHQLACPLTGSDWCHFSIRLPRSRDHLLMKDASVPYEDEKFSYLVAVRPGLFTPADRSRIIAPVRVNKIGATAKLCTTQGTAIIDRIASRNRIAFKAAKKLVWGDEL